VEIPPAWRGRRLLLHFGAVDWEARAWVNEKEVGSHKGGYDPFTFDLTAALSPSGKQEIVLSVWDPTDHGTQPRGKQVRRPEGIWYTPATGIWQTAWLEPVPEASIESLKIVPDVDGKLVRLSAALHGAPKGALALRATVFDGEMAVSEAGGPASSVLELKNLGKLWTPDSPFLHGLKVSLVEDGKAVDEVSSYFGLRKIALGKDQDGITRLLLNNEFVFQLGPLDQGFWPDGIYTAPTDEALRYDIEVTKQLGFNMARKHVKVEPDRWYYHCDKLGLLVWQDMPSGDRYIGGNDPDITRTPESAGQFEAELKALIDARSNHPSIVMWVPFNEGWGQFDTKRVVDWIKTYDPTRLVDNASGWSDRGAGDVHDIHVYPGPGSPRPEEHRAAVLGEFGGLGLPLSGHTWQNEKNWGYRTYKSREELAGAYTALIQGLRPLIRSPGLSAAVYTQTTDVEVEVNGLMTYDRALIKPDATQATAANRKVYLPPPRIEEIVPTSERQGIEWRWTTKAPKDGWQRSGFDDSGWQRGSGGFGNPTTPGAAVRTDWRTPDIWIRRKFELPAGFKAVAPQLSIHHDEDAEVFVNGVLAAKTTGYTTSYVPLVLSAEARAALRPGANTLAIHCKQTAGGQYIDAGIVEVIEVSGK
jgi:hypothetical protein